MNFRGLICTLCFSYGSTTAWSVFHSGRTLASHWDPLGFSVGSPPLPFGIRRLPADISPEVVEVELRAAYEPAMALRNQTECLTGTKEAMPLPTDSAMPVAINGEPSGTGFGTIATIQAPSASTELQLTSATSTRSIVGVPPPSAVALTGSLDHQPSRKANLRLEWERRQGARGPPEIVPEEARSAGVSRASTDNPTGFSSWRR